MAKKPKETKDYTLREVVVGFRSEDAAERFPVRRRFPAIEETPAEDILLLLMGDKPAFVIEKRLRDSLYAEELTPEKPTPKVVAPVGKKPVKAEEKPVAKPSKGKDEAKTKPKDEDDIDALIREIDGEGEGNGGDDAKGKDDDED